MPTTPPELESHLPRFGLTTFRPGQRRVIETVFAGRDCLCIMPTGGGKSLCYQLPAVARKGTVLVISPLIALMQDQVEGLLARQISATYINSSLTASQQAERMTAMAEGRYDLVYIAPERMRSQAFLDSLAVVEVQLLAIDEAHCISQWGHDFRPDYARLGRLRRLIGSPQTIALTATATNTVQQDVCDILELKQPARFVTGFARENLSLSVVTPSSNSVKDQMLGDFLKHTPGSGIVYCSTRKSCEHVTELLQPTMKRSVATYHAGLDAGSRRNIQERFSAGKIDVIVATNAFGMGIDKADLRFVVHYNLPGSVEAYYQEAGRAGRDGNPARCVMLFSWQDRFIQEFFIENSYPSPEIVRQVYAFLCQCPMDPIELTLAELKDELGVSIGTEGIRVSETLLEKAGAIERLDTQQNQASVRITSELPTIVDLLPREAKVRRSVIRAIEARRGTVRDERIWFSTGSLASELNITSDSLVRALRELNKLDCVDYVPPFRGRAVHVRKRVAFDSLEIDFEELQKRKDEEYRRLAAVIAFAESRQCRQTAILKYFGDEHQGDCGHCDNCTQTSGLVATVPTDHDRIGDLEIKDNLGTAYALQVAISGVARTKGRVGQALVGQMLAGSKAQKVKQLGLTRLPTWGKLSQLGHAEASELIGVLVDSGLVRKDETQRFRPVVSITARGAEFMQGDHLSLAIGAVSLRLRKRLNRLYGNEQPVLRPSPNEARVARLETPSPRPASNSSSPSRQPAAAAHDTNQGKRAPATAESPATERVDSPETESTAARPVKRRPSWYWTWRLQAAEFTMEEIAEIRRMPLEEVQSHLDTAVDDELS